jgi:hypothetical protein
MRAICPPITNLIILIIKIRHMTTSNVADRQKCSYGMSSSFNIGASNLRRLVSPLEDGGINFPVTSVTIYLTVRSHIPDDILFIFASVKTSHLASKCCLTNSTLSSQKIKLSL